MTLFFVSLFSVDNVADRSLPVQSAAAHPGGHQTGCSSSPSHIGGKPISFALYIFLNFVVVTLYVVLALVLIVKKERKKENEKRKMHMQELLNNFALCLSNGYKET